MARLVARGAVIVTPSSTVIWQAPASMGISAVLVAPGRWRQGQVVADGGVRVAGQDLDWAQTPAPFLGSPTMQPAAQQMAPRMQPLAIVALSSGVVMILGVAATA
jgi:hypothetical protein